MPFDLSDPNRINQIKVKPGDTLASLCKEVYGDELLLIPIAEYNGLNKFRDLQPGTAVLFPPLLKD